MKKSFVKIIAVALILVTCLSVLAACGGLSGTYSGKADLFGLAGATVDYKFAGSKVTITTKVEIFGVGSENSLEGTYKLVKADDGTQEIVFTFEGEDADTYSGTFSFEKGEDSIKIGGVSYTKKK